MGSSGSPRRPAYMTDDIEIELHRYTSRIRDFLQGTDGLPLWGPPGSWEGSLSWNQEEIDRLNGMKIPALIHRDESRRHMPDMLLYQLGNLGLLDTGFPDRLHEVVSGEGHIYISNSSGTGKTRLIFETLANHWGLYFTCTSDAIVDPYGSRDLRAALDRLTGTHIDGMGFDVEIPDSIRLSSRWRMIVENNRRIATRVINQVILTRLYVLDHFCGILRDINIPDDVARMKWLLIQLRPRSVLSTDIFSSIAYAVRLLSDADVATHIGTLYKLHCSRIGFVSIDESNVAMEAFPMAFMTADHRRRVPFLRQLVLCMANGHPASRLIVAGTLLAEDVVTEPIQCSSSKIRSLRVLHDLGYFGTLARTKVYLVHFLGHALSEDDIKTVHTWFRGRHRFLAVLVQYLLVYGPRRLRGVMDSIIYRFTGHKRSDIHPFEHVNIGLAFRDEVLEESPIALSLRGATLNCALYQRASSFNSHSRKLVGLGAALYGADVSVARIFEPLIMLNLARWLLSSPAYGILGVIQTKGADDGVALDNACFAEGLAACLRDTLGPRPSSPPGSASSMPTVSASSSHSSDSSLPHMQAILDFSGPAPAWACQSARLVLPQLSHRRSRFAAYSYDTDVSVQLATTPDDVFRWLNNASRPFLIPDPDFGAALLFVIELSDSQKLLATLDQRFLRERRSFRDRRLVPLKHEDFYKQDPHNRARLFSALKNFSLPAKAGARRSAHSPPSKFNMLQLLCFARPYRSGTTYDPPVAALKLSYLRQQRRPVEFKLSLVLDWITGSKYFLR